jgi:hypothetical protein
VSKPKKLVLIVGRLGTGLKFYGPVAGMDAAATVDRLFGGKNIEWQVAILEDVPDEIKTDALGNLEPEDDEEEENRFLNYYKCPRCEHEWTDEWSATCDDDCPNCGCRHVSPYKSEDLPEADKAGS